MYTNYPSTRKPLTSLGGVVKMSSFLVGRYIIIGNTMKKKVMVIGVVAGIACELFFLWGIVKNVSLPLGHHDDIDYGYFLIDHNLKKITALDFAHFWDTRMFYPHTNTLAYGNSLIPQSILGLPVYLATHNTILTANFVILLLFFLSFFSMYLLSFSVTQSPLASIIAGIVYTYNPFIMSHVPQTIEKPHAHVAAATIFGS